MNCFSAQLRALRAPSRQAGLTLMEVLLVLVILVVLSAIAVPIYSNIRRGAEIKLAKIQVGLLEDSVELYRMDASKLPTRLNDLVQPPSDSKASKRWTGPYLKHNASLTDPWEGPYQYAATGTHNVDNFDIWSLGPDTADGTPDDIGNWD